MHANDISDLQMILLNETSHDNKSARDVVESLVDPRDLVTMLVILGYSKNKDVEALSDLWNTSENSDDDMYIEAVYAKVTSIFN